LGEKLRLLPLNQRRIQLQLLGEEEANSGFVYWCVCIMEGGGVMGRDEQEIFWEPGRWELLSNHDWMNNYHDEGVTRPIFSCDH